MSAYNIVKKTAIECLQGMIRAHQTNDMVSLAFFTIIYNDTLADLRELHEANNKCLNNGRMGCMVNDDKREMSDSGIDVNGNLIYRNEDPC